MRGPVLLLAAVLALPCFAGDRDFDTLVKNVESRYGIRRTRIPFFGVVNFCVKVARPGGATGLKLAVFEDLSLADVAGDFTGVVDSTLGPDWHPFVRVHSSRDRESVVIYNKVKGKDLRLLIAAMEPREVSIVQLRINADALRRWYEEPARMARNHGSTLRPDR